jgi:hypothetical protein
MEERGFRFFIRLAQRHPRLDAVHRPAFQVRALEALGVGNAAAGRSTVPESLHLSNCSAEGDLAPLAAVDFVASNNRPVAGTGVVSLDE